MDNYWQNNSAPKATRLIKVLFGILLGIISVCVLSLFIFKVNEVSEAKIGEIIAENPPIEYVAPFDIENMEINVREGDFVYEGDTLAILRNEKILKDYISNNHEIEMLQDNIDVYQEMVSNLKTKGKYIRKNKYNLKRKRKSSNKLSDAEQESVSAQLKASRREYEIAQKNYKIDKQLYKERVISKRDFDRTEQEYLVAQRDYELLSKNADKEVIKKEDIDIEYVGKINEERLKSIDAEQDYLNTKKELNDLKKTLSNVETDQLYQERLLEQQFIIADDDGFVQFLFNTKKSKNVLKKGERLMIVTPREKQAFYAKLEMRQQAIKSVKMNQVVHLELDAYDVLKYGITKAKVSYVSEGDKNNEFYVLAEIEELNPNYELKNGYQVKADIILDRVPLYDFILKRLFNENEIYEEIKTQPRANK